MRTGVHISTGGDLARAPEIAGELGCEAIQIFSGNPRGYTKPPLKQETISAFRAGIEKLGIHPTIVHATYLINLAAPKDEIYRLSVESFLDELRRTRDLGGAYYVLHIGNHGGAGMEEGRRRVADAFRRAMGEIERCPKILVENTSGSGTSLGGTFEDVAALFDAVGRNIGLCFDTCHALAAGYDIRTEEGTGRTLDLACRLLGRESLLCVHVNDSKAPLGSHVDRHEHVGMGEIGEKGFRAFFSDRRLAGLPAILETPKDSPDADARNLAALRAVLSGAPIPVEAATPARSPRAKAGAKAAAEAGSRSVARTAAGAGPGAEPAAGAEAATGAKAAAGAGDRAGSARGGRAKAPGRGGAAAGGGAGGDGGRPRGRNRVGEKGRTAGKDREGR
ncbi:MAG: deoxyribonuclease IV [Planctomycetota bacterium]|nr:deoxyribonuclease IV [Planctomycetota bacterium]